VPVPDFADDLAGRIDDAERLEKIYAALSTLRRTERDVLALCVWSGLNYAEAAEALGVPVGTVRSRLLQSIPTQPDALLAYLKAGKKWTNDDPPTEIGDMIRETIMPPALAAALYRLAATLPGATLVPHATNVAGRAGIGIMWTSKTAKQVYKNEWIFDKSTLRFIGEKTYDPGTGRLTGESAIVQQAFTATAGQLP
jgi:hypothetical protein